MCEWLLCLFIWSVVFFKYKIVFFFKQKTAYEMRISDWSSDVCSSDLLCHLPRVQRDRAAIKAAPLRNREAKHRERGELCGEGLGRCDADLRAGACHQRQIGLAHDR